MRLAAIYARVSSEQQREEHTIASQTAALIEFAKSHELEVPKEWVFEDEGYSGATLERPGLERVRDLAAEGQIQAVLAYAPDRLSRKYAYQVLLIEELARHGVETLFVKAPQGASAEDQLLVQFQGMIAEYERAQILERSRRGKRHRALHKRLSGRIREQQRKRLYFLHRWPSQRSMMRVRARVRELTPGSRCHADIRTVIADLNPVLRGWGNYFRAGNAADQFNSIDGFVVRRLRTLRKQRKGRHLRPGEVRCWTREYFERLGLYRLRGSISYPEQPFWMRPA